MDTLMVLIESVKIRKPVSFKYASTAQTPITRVGNVHAVFKITEDSGIERTKVHIVQTEGVSNRIWNHKLNIIGEFDVADLIGVELLEKEAEFEVDRYYDSEWDGYGNSIVKL